MLAKGAPSIHVRFLRGLNYLPRRITGTRFRHGISSIRWLRRRGSDYAHDPYEIFRATSTDKGKRNFRVAVLVLR